MVCIAALSAIWGGGGLGESYQLRGSTEHGLQIVTRLGMHSSKLACEFICIRVLGNIIDPRPPMSGFKRKDGEILQLQMKFIATLLCL